MILKRKHSEFFFTIHPILRQLISCYWNHQSNYFALYIDQHSIPFYSSVLQHMLISLPGWSTIYLFHKLYCGNSHFKTFQNFLAPWNISHCTWQNYILSFPGEPNVNKILSHMNVFLDKENRYLPGKFGVSLKTIGRLPRI